MPERVVRTTLIIDDRGSVRVVKGLGEESQRTEGKLSHLDRETKKLGSSFGGLKGMLAGGLGVLGAGGLAFGLGSIVSKTKELTQETEKFQSISGLGTNTSLRYMVALKARGVSTESVGKALFKLGQNIKMAEQQETKLGNVQAKAALKGKVVTAELGKQAAAFQALGITAKDFGKLTEEQKLDLLVKRLSAMRDGTEKNRIAQALFSKGAAALIPVLKQGALGLEANVNMAKKYFPMIKGEGKQAMAELLQKQAESKMAWEGLQFTLGTKLIPVLTSVMGTFSNLVAEFNKGKGPLKEIAKVFEGIAHFGEDAFTFIKGIAEKLGIHLGAGTAGGALLALMAGRRVAGPAAAPLVKAGKFAVGHPEFAPLAAGAALPFGSAIAIHAGASLFEPHQPRGNLGLPASGGSSGRTGGRPALGGGETASEAALVARAIEGLKATSDEHRVSINIDGAKVAEAMLRNPRAKRQLAEAVALYSTQMGARR